MRSKLFTLYFMFLLIVFGCQPVSEVETEPTTSLSLTPMQISTVSSPILEPPSTPTTPVIESPTMSGNIPTSELVEKAKTDLAKRLGIALDQIQVVEARAVTWPDASLGCPQPGMMYAQVLTPGYLILLEANNQEFEYHAGKGSEVVYCENPSQPVPDVPGDI